MVGWEGDLSFIVDFAWVKRRVPLLAIILA